MTLPIATRLGPYQILSPLGAGGMGEVYRARDTRLGREVAIKVLPPEVSADADRLRRFEKEARAASSLNHPNIVTIHEVERIDSTSFIVLELVDGKTLREIVSEGALPVRRLLAIAVQIAEGLARAHSAGIVHRDLKPENVMVTKEGLVKILDFGLAKLAHPDLESGEEAESPTVSAGTKPGVVMGTVGYMSPEQASGHPVDFRSDQFSFGSLLYEMATGKGPFRRATAAQTLAAIIQDEPEPVAEANPKVPAPLRWIVERCLAKDPRERYASTDDLARDLANVRDHLSEISSSREAVAMPSRQRNRFFWQLAVGVATLVVVALAAAYLRRAPRQSLPIRSSLTFLERMVLQHLALSPDGRRLAFTAQTTVCAGCSAASSTGGSLWMRALDGSAPQPIAAGNDVSLPFWSPDNRYLAFFSDGKLKKVDAAGGAIQTICDAEFGGGGTWGPDGSIIFAPGTTSALYKVSAAGGRPVAVTKLDTARHEKSHRYPHLLPDGMHFLYMATDLASARDDPPNAIRLASLDGKLDKLVVQMASNAAYAAGHLLYARENTLVAQPFDLGRLETAGDAVPIGRVWMLPKFHFQFDASERVLVLAPPLTALSALLWFDRNGQAGGALGAPAVFFYPRLSPDGRKVAVDVIDPARDTVDIWIYDAATGVGTKFALGSPRDESPVWSPEGDRIAFAAYRRGRGLKTTLLVKPINGVGEKVLLESPDETSPDDWSSDGRFVSLFVLRAEGKRYIELWILNTDGRGKAVPFATDAPSQFDSRFSPDGRWIAYESDEGSGTPEVFVRPFPGPGGRWQVSTAGGRNPIWRRDGKELFYRSAENKIMAVSVRLDPTFQAGSPAALFSVRPPPNRWGYDVSADGRRFLVNTATGDESSPPLTLIADWTALLKR
jgi:serine/threonine protein kinase/Tol biopolymer transport system component